MATGDEDARDEGRAALARSIAYFKQASKTAHSFKQALKQAGIRVPPAAECRPPDLAAVRSSIRKAAVEAEVEKRLAAQTGADPLLRIAEVKEITGLGRTTIWEFERRGEFPRRVKRAGARSRAVGWSLCEVMEWKERRKAARQE